MKNFVLVSMLSIFIATGCTADSTRPADASPEKASVADRIGPVDPAFGDHWYQGKAELTSYTLEQGRYRETHKGHAVLIFVTEDFSKSKHVKLDRPSQAGDDKVNVMKLNFTKKFNTGIYPYSMMSSVFTPISRNKYPQTLKVSTSSQEWCGHSFTQLNLGDEGYKVHLYSYFERENDQTLMLDQAIPEDEIWTTIRLNPNDLPLGDVKLIPGTLYQRLSHAPWKVQAAHAELKPDNGGMRSYVVTYPELDRTLTIRFKSAFPHEIESWEDAYQSRGRTLSTKATVKKRIWLDYWSKNSVKDEALRADLGLE